MSRSRYAGISASWRRKKTPVKATKSFPLLRASPCLDNDNRRASSVKINIEQIHDNKAYRESAEEALYATRKVSKEHLYDTAETAGAGESGNENIENGEHLDETSDVVTVVVESGTNLAENTEEEVLSESNGKDVTKF